MEQHRTLQDSFDQVQAEAKFEADETKQQLQERQQEADGLRAQLKVGNLKTVGFDQGFNVFAVDVDVIESNPLFHLSFLKNHSASFKKTSFLCCVFYSSIVGIK